jgi:hypothetical protein
MFVVGIFNSYTINGLKYGIDSIFFLFIYYILYGKISNNRFSYSNYCFNSYFNNYRDDAFDGKKNKPWPPMNAQCLDYWEIDGSGNCVDTMDLAKLKCPNGNVTSTNGHSTMNFNTPPYVGAKGACAKYNWAKQCGLSWDGVTYGVKNPCQS